MDLVSFELADVAFACTPKVRGLEESEMRASWWKAATGHSTQRSGIVSLVSGGQGVHACACCPTCLPGQGALPVLQELAFVFSCIDAGR